MTSEPLTLFCHDGKHGRCRGYIAPTYRVACHCSCHEVDPGGDYNRRDPSWRPGHGDNTGDT